jgi:transposase
MDNHSSGKATRQFIRVAGVKFIFLPKYSPDLNLIEQMIFAERKHLLRKAPHASSKRSAPQLLESLLIHHRRMCKPFLNFSGYA